MSDISRFDFSDDNYFWCKQPFRTLHRITNFITLIYRWQFKNVIYFILLCFGWCFNIIFLCIVNNIIFYCMLVANTTNTTSAAGTALCLKKINDTAWNKMAAGSFRFSFSAATFLCGETHAVRTTSGVRMESSRFAFNVRIVVFFQKAKEENVLFFYI